MMGNCQGRLGHENRQEKPAGSRTLTTFPHAAKPYWSVCKGQRTFSEGAEQGATPNYVGTKAALKTPSPSEPPQQP